MSPRTKKQFEEIREERKALIMDTALLHFANEGYHTTTINHIARHAGISKGLMYNYFESKEALLEAIIDRSVAELYKDFDSDRDGYLSEDEFEFFVRRLAQVLREKQDFWRLLFQLLMQNEVRERFFRTLTVPGTLPKPGSPEEKELFLPEILAAVYDYFVRKTGKKGSDYNPYIEMNMFIISLKGLAITYVFSSDENYKYLDVLIDRIIQQYK